MSEQEKIDRFLEGSSFAVAGASTDRGKYGNKVLRCYMQTDRMVYPINPKADKVEGLTAYPKLASLPAAVHGVSVVLPPPLTEKVIQQAAELGIKHVWLQPGAESEHAVALAEQSGINIISGGPCLLVVLGYRETG